MGSDPISSRRFALATFVLLLIASVVAAANPSITDDGENGTDWDQVRDWVRQETPKTEKFLTTTTGADFSVIALRSSVSVGGGALAWIDPVMFQESKVRLGQVKKAKSNGMWDLDALSVLARDWGASYLLVKGPFTPQGSQPLCTFGVYAVFDAGAPPECCQVS
jgi:hypothetical protein